MELNRELLLDLLQNAAFNLLQHSLLLLHYCTFILSVCLSLSLLSLYTCFSNTLSHNCKTKKAEVAAELNHSIKKYACMFDDFSYLLAAGLSDLFHFIVFALDLLGMGLTQTLHLHFKTQLGLEGKHKHILHSAWLKETLF